MTAIFYNSRDFPTRSPDKNCKCWNICSQSVQIWGLKREISGLIMCESYSLSLVFFLIQVERITFDGWSIVLGIERSCTAECLYGCRYNGYGITYKRCYSCCRSRNCNTGGNSPYLRLNYPLLVFCSTLAVLLQANTWRDQQWIYILYHISKLQDKTLCSFAN